MRLIKGDKEDLIAILEEYLKIFKNEKEHQKAHKKEPCMICHRAKEILKKLKDNLNDEELLNNPHIRKSLIQIGKGEGKTGRFMIKIREGRVSDKEIADWLKKDFKKTLKASKRRK